MRRNCRQTPARALLRDEYLRLAAITDARHRFQVTRVAHGRHAGDFEAARYQVAIRLARLRMVRQDRPAGVQSEIDNVSSCSGTPDCIVIGDHRATTADSPSPARYR